MMVSYIIGKYGISNLDDYVRSFHLSPGGALNENMADLYKANFKSVYRISWDDNVNKFKDYLAEKKRLDNR